MPVGLYDLGHLWRIVFAREIRKRTGIGKYDLNLEGLPLFADTVGPHGKRDERFGAHHDNGRDERILL